jgi:hypothetical protein
MCDGDDDPHCRVHQRGHMTVLEFAAALRADADREPWQAFKPYL